MRALLLLLLAAAPLRAAVTLPFDLVDNRILIPVTVNGRGPYRMILDTGAGGLLVRDEVAQELGLAATSKDQEHGAGEATVTVSASRVDSVRLGGLDLGPLECHFLSFADAPSLWGNERLDGVIGLPVFEGRIVRIDYERRRIAFEERSAFRPPRSAIRIPFERAGHIPMIAARLAGTRGRFGIHTGARSSLILYGPFVERNGLRQKLGAGADMITGWGIGGAIRAQLARIPTLDLGGVAVRGVVARLSTQKSGALAGDWLDGLIGPEVLRQFTVTFDYGAMSMFLEKNARYGRADRWDGTGMWLGQRGDVFAVLDVMPGGPAADAGLHTGDEIVAIDGRPTGSLSLPSERLRLYYDGKPRRIELTLRDGRSIALALRRLV